MNPPLFGKIPLVLSLAALLSSCGKKDELAADEEAAAQSAPATTMEATAQISPWMSKAGVVWGMERLPEARYFSQIEGRLKNGANEYRATTESFDADAHREWSVVLGLTEKELFAHELRLLRAGFQRHHAQVFTDSSGVALHQLTMLKPAESASGESGGEAKKSASLTPARAQPEVGGLIQAEPAPEARATPVQVVAIGDDEPALNGAPLAEIPDTPLPEIDPASTHLSTQEPSSTAPSEVSEESTLETVSYRVVRGDTLSGIASRYGASVAEIKEINGLSSDMIRLNQALKIPKK